MPYAGFDRADCPDLKTMADLKAKSNFTWCGFYLPAPSQAGSTWKGKRGALVRQGWGLAPIFVGQQAVGPGAHSVTAAQGKVDGERAAADMRAEGFPTGSCVYLDLENGPPFATDQKTYVGAWITAVQANGFAAGVYCSYLFGAQVKALWSSVRLWVFHVHTTRAHAIAGEKFDCPYPAESGVAAAEVWQRDDEGRLSAFGALAVDLDTATMRDPSAPAVTTVTSLATAPRTGAVAAIAATAGAAFAAAGGQAWPYLGFLNFETVAAFGIVACILAALVMFARDRERSKTSAPPTPVAKAPVAAPIAPAPAPQPAPAAGAEASAIKLPPPITPAPVAASQALPIAPIATGLAPATVAQI